MDAAGSPVGAWHFTPVKNIDDPVDEPIDNADTYYIDDPENIGKYTPAANADMRIVRCSVKVMVRRWAGFLHFNGFR